MDINEPRRIVPCEKCHGKIRLPANYEGIKLRCPHCKLEFLGRFSYLNVRAEWIIWHLISDFDTGIERIKAIGQIPDEQWKNSRERILRETMLWSLALAATVIHEKIRKDELEDIERQFAIYTELLFPEQEPYKNLYMLAQYQGLCRIDPDDRKDADFFIERLSHILGTDEARLAAHKDDFLVDFPHGWLIGMNAFWTGMEQPPEGMDELRDKFSLEKAYVSNKASRHRFGDRVIRAEQIKTRGESDEEKNKREAWFKAVEQTTEAASELRREVEAELKRRKKSKGTNGEP